MSLNKQLRVPMLIFAFASVICVFGRSILDPTVGKRTVTPFVFPSAVPLPQWQLAASQPTGDRTVQREPYGKLVLPGWHYRYIPNNIHASSQSPIPPSLDIEMRYEVQMDGNVKQLIKDNTAIQVGITQPLLILRQRQGIGFYGLFVYQKRAYLDACINPRGTSTFTEEQFKNNRIRYDTQFNRLLPWLLGQQDLSNQRCLWTHLSIPLNQSSPESSYHILENVWFAWYEWWHTRFPKI